MTRLDPAAAALDVKRTATLLRDARAVLRRVDVLAATALAIDDPALPAIAELRSSAERLVSQLAHREQAQQAPGQAGGPASAVRSVAHAGRWYGDAVTRADLHRLVDALPDASVEAAALWLERVRDPMIARLETAPVDDEPFTEEERRQVYAALLRLDAGEAVPLEELLAELDQTG